MTSLVTRTGLFLLGAAACSLVFTSANVRAAPGGGGGGGAAGGGFQSSSRDPDRLAERDYKRGLRKRDSAWKREKKADTARSEKKRDKELSKAAKDWRTAVEHYRAAIDKKERYPEAHTSLGYALRKLGQYQASIKAYDRALAIKPGFSEAIEYRAEAYLALDRIEDAGRSYRRLWKLDRERAQMLMTAMEQWLGSVETRGEDDPSVPTAKVEWFRKFVEERKHEAMRNREATVHGTRW